MPIPSSVRTVCLLVGLSTAACAPDPLVGVAPLAAATTTEPTLSFTYTVEGPRLTSASDVAYYLVLDTNGNTKDGPRINGSAPRSHPAPDPRANLPFVRSEDDILDREPIAVEDSTWTDYFALAQENGRWAMWQGRRQPDGTVTERLRELTPGTEWGIVDGRTVQLRVPLTYMQVPTPLPVQFEANLAVSRVATGPDTTGRVIDAWRPLPAPSPSEDRRPDTGLPGFLRTLSGYSQGFLVIPTSGAMQTDDDPSPIAVPGNVVGRADALNLVRYTARIAPPEQAMPYRTRP